MATAITLPFSRYTSLLTPILERAERDPEHRTLAFIDDAGTTRWVTLGELHARALERAQALRALDVRRGDVVVLVLGHSPDLIFTFVGALYLGAIPTIFPYLTEKLDPTIYAERVRALVTGSGARAVVTAAAFRELMTRSSPSCDCRIVGAAEPPAADGDLNRRAPTQRSRTSPICNTRAGRAACTRASRRRTAPCCGTSRPGSRSIRSHPTT